MMDLTREEVAALPFDVALAYICGYRWYWDKRDNWNITRPDGSTEYMRMEWTEYNPHTGKKRVKPKHPAFDDLQFYPYGEWLDDKNVAFSLMEKYHLSPIAIKGDGEWRWHIEPLETEYKHLDEAICRCVYKLYIEGHIEAGNPKSRAR